MNEEINKINRVIDILKDDICSIIEEIRSDFLNQVYKEYGNLTKLINKEHSESVNPTAR